MASDIHVALGPNGIMDYKKLLVDAQGYLLTAGTSTLSGSVNVAPPKSQRVTTMDMTDVAAAIPTSAFTSRITISIHNLSATDTLYISTNPLVEANRNVGTLAGWEIGPGETLNEDLDVGTVYYGITEAGKTVRIKVKEGSST